VVHSMICVFVAVIGVEVQHRQENSQHDGGKNYRSSDSLLQTKHNATIHSAAGTISLSRKKSSFMTCN